MFLQMLKTQATVAIILTGWSRSWAWHRIGFIGSYYSTDFSHNL